MTRVQHSGSLVLDPATVSSLYPQGVQSVRGRDRIVPLSPEVLDMLPTAAKRAIRKALDAGGVKAFLVTEGDQIVIVIRNKRR